MPITASTQLTPFQDLLNQVITEANGKVQFGTGSVTIATAGTAATDAISFSPAYTTAPVVIAVARTSAPTKRAVSPGLATTTGCTITGLNEDSNTAVAYYWIAVGT